MCLMSVCLAVSLASQRALTCSFIHQSPLALWVIHPPFLLHLFLYHFLADHLSLYPSPLLSHWLSASLSLSLCSKAFLAFVCLVGKGGACLSFPHPYSLIPPSERKRWTGGVLVRKLRNRKTKWPKFPPPKALLVSSAEGAQRVQCKGIELCVLF